MFSISHYADDSSNLISTLYLQDRAPSLLNSRKHHSHCSPCEWQSLVYSVMVGAISCISKATLPVSDASHPTPLILNPLSSVQPAYLPTFLALESGTIICLITKPDIWKLPTLQYKPNHVITCLKHCITSLR